MRIASYMIAALLAGLVLGSWSLRADLRRARQEIDGLRASARTLEAKNTRLDGIVAMLNISKNDGMRPVQGGQTRAMTSSPTSTVSSSEARRSNPFIPPHMRDRNRDSAAAPRSMHDQIQAATELWKMRGAVARTTFLSNLDADAAAATQFDVVMAAMNLRLSNSIRTWVDSAKENDDFSSESGLRMMNDLSTVLVNTYDELDRTLPGDWRIKSGTNFEVMAFINPEVASPLVDIEDKLSTRRRSGETFSGGGNQTPLNRGP